MTSKTILSDDLMPNSPFNGHEQIKNIFVYVLLYWAISIIAIVYIDKPLALLIHYYKIDQQHWLTAISEPSTFIISVATITVLLLDIDYKNRVLGLVMLLDCCVMLKITLYLKNTLKILFARYWPTTWDNGNLSLISHNIYGFAGSLGHVSFYGSFPSGHAVHLAFCLIWLLYCKPKLAILWYAVAAMFLLSLLLLNYHFLGDILAGISLGILCGSISIWIWNRFNLFYQRSTHH